MLSFLLQILTLAAASGITIPLSGVIRNKFLIYQPVAFAMILSGIVLLLLFQSIVSFTSLTRARMAEEIDRREHLLDRLTTYLQLRDSEHAFLPPLVGEMESKLEGVSSFRSARFRTGFAGPLSFFLVILAAAFLIHTLPESQKAALQREERAVIHKEAARLQKTIIDLTKAGDPEIEKLLKAFERTAREMQTLDTTKAEALKQLNAMAEQLGAEQARINQNFDRQLGKILDSQKQSASSDTGTQNDSSEGSRNSGAEKQLDAKIRNAEAGKQSKATQQEKLRKAMEDYKAEKQRSEKEMAALSKALDEAHKGMTPVGNRWTAGSEISDRDMEKKEGGVQDGPGTTNKDLGPHKFDTHKDGKSEYIEDRTKTKYEELYKGQRETVKTDPLFLENKWSDDSNRRYVNVRTFGVNKDSSAALNNGVANGQDSQESAIRKERIPASYGKIVKQYFQSIQDND